MEKIKVGILGCTGSVGQKFIQLLEEHPVFEIAELAASERSAGKSYREATKWMMDRPLNSRIAEMMVIKAGDKLESGVLFSALDSSVAGEIETLYAKAGHVVISNAKNHRFDKHVPLIIPEVNPDHLEMTKDQKIGKGCIVTNPNCSTIGLVMALKPLHDKFGIEKINVVTMQAMSGAGYPGLSSMDIFDNVIPFIDGEEEKIETEPNKILGEYIQREVVKLAEIDIAAQCNRVNVIDGHLETVQIKFKEKPDKISIIQAWDYYIGEPQELGCYSAPTVPIHYFEEDNFPQPRLHRNIEKGMAVSVGRLRKCNHYDYKFVVMSHNTIRGAAGGTILIAELMEKKGMLK